MTTGVDKRLGRRGAVVGIGVAVAGVAVGLPREGSGQAREPGRPDEPADPTERPDALAAHALAEAGEDVRALFGALGEGADVGSHWRIEAIFALRAGAIPVVLSTRSGHRFAVEVFRAAADPAPLATAGPLGVYVVNRGDGDEPTDEASGLGAIALARALEGRLAAGAPVPADLVTMPERRRRHPTGVFHVPV